jgi:hypothetical protein
LRIEGQQDDTIGIPRFHIACRLRAERLPIAHGNESARVMALQCQRLFQRTGLGLCFLKDGGAAANLGIDLASNRRSPSGDEPSQRLAHEPRQSQNCFVAEQIAQERLHRFRRIRSSKIEQDDSEFHRRTYTGFSYHHFNSKDY